MDLPSLYRLIDLQPEMADRLARVGGALDMERLEPCLAQLLERDAAARGYEALRTLLGEDAGGLGMLYCQLECARRAWERYRERGIGPAVYRDTMRCFPSFLAECRERNGRMFFDRGWWTYRQTSMGLFRVPEGTAAEAFPEGTSLQRGVKALVLGGGAVGSALGVMDR